MFNSLGFSIYLSSFEDQKEMLKRFSGSGNYIFTSFHIQEEFDSLKDYTKRAEEMCIWLKNREFKIIGDISKKTLEFFRYDSILEFARDMDIDVLRIDYGFSEKEILDIANEYPISFNPSTEDEIIANKILQTGTKLFALHNFYPRPETGLDIVKFEEINNKLKDLDIELLAFIPGDEKKRRPIFEGLPTLESHRNIPPYISFLDLKINHHMDGIFVGDIKLSNRQIDLISSYIKNDIISIPIKFLEGFEYLYEQVFTIRIDSPKNLLRLQESREYATKGETIKPFNTVERLIGSITMDNEEYKRYSGEIQILNKNLKQDNKVNVIGHVDQEYLGIMDCIKNGCKIRFINIK